MKMECEQCDWSTEYENGQSQHEINKQATAHFTETGHTVRSVGYEPAEVTTFPAP